MMALLFTLLLVSVLLAWKGFRTKAICGYAITLGLATIWFAHHATDKLSIQL